MLGAISRYRYDPERLERRRVVVAASSSRREFNACINAVWEEIDWRTAAGEQVDPSEHISGTVHEPRLPPAGSRTVDWSCARFAIGSHPGHGWTSWRCPRTWRYSAALPGPVNRRAGWVG